MCHGHSSLKTIEALRGQQFASQPHPYKNLVKAQILLLIEELCICILTILHGNFKE